MVTGSSSNSAAEEASPNDAAAAAEGPKSHVPMGVPSWVLRNGGAEEERCRATPPPIVLNPRHARKSTNEAEGPASSPLLSETTATGDAPQDANADGRPLSQQVEAGGPGAVAGGGPGSRRKWLPAFGRPSTSKNKND